MIQWKGGSEGKCGGVGRGGGIELGSNAPHHAQVYVLSRQC